jgi:crotonobetainyl-CoA:carnitine CoA-transferase CaiB-like acyl-CoA transferase
VSLGNVLSGIRVVDLTAVMAGASGSMFLADLGADVIKVEKTTGGDIARDSTPYLFQAVNRNKRSLGLNIDTAEGLEIAQSLISGADVVVQSFRPGALEQRGLGAQTLTALYPKLVYASLSGYGTTGPGAARRGIDHVVQAESGMASVMGGVNLRLSLVDGASGIALAQAVLAALLKREREGVGSVVEVSLYDTALWLQMLPIAEYGATRVPPLPSSEYVLRSPTKGTFAVADGHVFIAVISQEHWLKLCEVIGAPELAADPRFAKLPDRIENAKELVAELTRVFLTWDRFPLLSAAEREGLMISPFKDYEDVFADPQSLANESFQTVVSAEGESVVQTRIPWRFLDGQTNAEYRRPPTLGEDTRDVLGELGYNSAEIDELENAGVVSKPGER